MKSKLVIKIIQTETETGASLLEKKGMVYSFLNPVSYLDALKHKKLFGQMDGLCCVKKTDSPLRLLLRLWHWQFPAGLTHKLGDIVVVIHICHIEVVFGTLIGWAQLHIPEQ